MVNICIDNNIIFGATLGNTILSGILGILAGPIIGYFFVGSTKRSISATATFYVRTMLFLISFAFIADFFQGLYLSNCQDNVGVIFGIDTRTVAGVRVTDVRYVGIAVITQFIVEVMSHYCAHTLMPSLLQHASMLMWGILLISLGRTESFDFLWLVFAFGAFIVIVWALMNYAYANMRPALLSWQHLVHVPTWLYLVVNWLWTVIDNPQNRPNSTAWDQAVPFLYWGTGTGALLWLAVATAILTPSRRPRNGDEDMLYPSYNVASDIGSEKSTQKMVKSVGNNDFMSWMFGQAATEHAE